MVHELLFNTLLLLGILGLSTSLLWVWRQRHAATSHAATRATGPAPKPRCMPLPALLYAQVVKSYRRRRVIRVRHRVVLGTVAVVNRVLEPLGWQINTAFIERANLAMRQHVAAIG